VLVYVWLLVEVVAVLADVVQLGVDGGVILSTTVLGHSSISFTDKIKEFTNKTWLETHHFGRVVSYKYNGERMAFHSF
jgi:hypothetical protein